MTEREKSPPVQGWKDEPPPGLLPDGTLCTVEPDEDEDLEDEDTEEEETAE